MNGSEREPLPEPVVSNAGPLITLATIGRLDLLKALFEQIFIPQAVFDEVVVHGGGEPGSQEVEQAKWIKTDQVEDCLAVNLLQESLGESETIVIAQELNARFALLDDGLARRKARLIGLRMQQLLVVNLRESRNT